MARRPNILWICTDQQRADTIGALGNGVIHTPNLDRLVEGGLAFDHAYCQNPICSPSRGSFLTGRYPRTTGLRQNGNDHFPRKERLVTKILAESGYDCGLVGKLHLSACAGRVEPRPDDGYRFFRWSHESQQHEETRHADCYDQWMKAKGVRYEDLYNRTGEVFPGVPEEYHHTPWAIDEAIRFLDQAQEPWLLSLNLYDPHPPFDPPPNYFKAHDLESVPEPNYREGELENKPLPQRIDHHGARAGTNKAVSYADMSSSERRQAVAAYYGMVELIDKELGRLFAALEERDLWNDTVILFMSDHGEMLGDHGIFYKGPYFYEQLIRVPLIFHYPRIISSGRRTGALVELVDLAPTLLELAGLPGEPAMQGRSLLPLLTDARQEHRESVYCEYYNTHTRYGGEPIYATMYRDRRYKLVVYHGRDEGELYDLEKDPNEFENRWWHDDALLHSLMKRCFDRSVFTLDPIPQRISIW